MNKISFFIAGIIQGSLPDSVHSQDYRKKISDLLKKNFSEVEIFNPIEKYPDSLEYSDEKAKSAFYDLMGLAAKYDILIAFVPEASMGTAIEMWQAKKSGKIVICVSPMENNWVVKFLPDVLLNNIDELEKYLNSGDIINLLNSKK